ARAIGRHHLLAFRHRQDTAKMLLELAEELLQRRAFGKRQGTAETALLFGLGALTGRYIDDRRTDPLGQVSEAVRQPSSVGGARPQQRPAQDERGCKAPAAICCKKRHRLSPPVHLSWLL